MKIDAGNDAFRIAKVGNVGETCARYKDLLYLVKVAHTIKSHGLTNEQKNGTNGSNEI